MLGGFSVSVQRGGIKDFYGGRWVFAAEMAGLPLDGDLIFQPLTFLCSERFEFHLGDNNLRGLLAEEVKFRSRLPIALRIAMLGAIAGLYSEQGVTIIDPDAINVSFPGFRPMIEAAIAVRRS